VRAEATFHAADDAITLRNLRISIPEESRTGNFGKTGSFDVRPQPKNAPLSIAAVPLTRISPWYSRGDETIEVRADILQQSTVCFPDELLLTQTVTPRQQFVYVWAGGVAGVIVVLLFRFFARQPKDKAAAPDWRTLAYGTMCVALGAALSYAGRKFTSLPFALDLRNIFGGFIAGLFFEPLGRAINKVLAK
jgi:hypothetical protein